MSRSREALEREVETCTGPRPRPVPNSSLRILHLEDDVQDAEIIQGVLEAGGVVCRVTRVETRDDFIASLEQGGFDLILADFSLPSFDGLSALQIALERCPDVPFIFVSGTLGEEVAIDALKIGATDYVLKERLSRIVSSVRRALREANENRERRKAEEALRASEQRFRDYAETASDWLWETGPDHRFTWFSRHARLTDDPAWRIGATRLEVAADVDEEPEKWSSHMAMLEAHEPFRGLTYRTVQADGSTAYIAVSGKPVFDARGGFCGYRGVGSDVTAAVRAAQAERALHQAQAELAHVARVTTLGELAASIAHEINQPLAAIVADTYACLNWLDAVPPRLNSVREALSAVAEDGNRAADVITRIRALLSKSSVAQRPCDLAGVIRDAVLLVRPELERHGIVVQTNVATDLPPVMGDRIQLQQVVLNLLMNSIQASRDLPPERCRLTVRATIEQRDGGASALVAVEDAGVGFSEQQAPRLFEAFYTTKPGGLGMGLSISRSIIERHGGRLWATANQGYGATFHFALPGIR